MDYNRFSAPRRGQQPASAPWPDDLEELLVSKTDDRQARLAAAVMRAGLIQPFANAVVAVAPQTPALMPAPARRRQKFRQKFRKSRPALLWGAIGFGIGIIFWHWIGFWSFIDDIVWPAASTTARRISAPVVALPTIDYSAGLPMRPAHPRIVKPAPAPTVMPGAPVESSAWIVTVDAVPAGAGAAP